MKDCVPNLQLDNLVRIVLKEKDEASKRYFEKLFKRSTDGGDKPADNGGVGGGGEERKKVQFSPVESLFQKHMRKSLAEFSGYHQTLIDKKEGQFQRIRDVYIDKMGKAKTEIEAKVSVLSRGVN
jgi:hypothetical protein